MSRGSADVVRVSVACLSAALPATCVRREQRPWRPHFSHFEAEILSRAFARATLIAVAPAGHWNGAALCLGREDSRFESPLTSALQRGQRPAVEALLASVQAEQVAGVTITRALTCANPVHHGL